MASIFRSERPLRWAAWFRRCSAPLAGGLGCSAAWGAGAAIGILNGTAITRLNFPPFISSLAAMLAAQGTALLLAAIFLRKLFEENKLRGKSES